MAFVSLFWDLWAWSALLVLLFRAVGVCVVAFASVNARVFVGASIQVYASSGGPGASSSTRKHNVNTRSNKPLEASPQRQNG
jgi:hypothetical protein